MKRKTFNAVKLGLFVLAGLVLAIFALYVLGKGQNFFGNRFMLKTQFRDVKGLLVGNNVRFSGIDVGSVRGIEILNDTVVEVTMNVDRKMKNIVRKNAIATIGTDGLIGNRVVNIAPTDANSPLITGGETLKSREEVNTEEMLRTLSGTNEDVSAMVEDLRRVAHLISTSSELEKILNDKTLAANLQASLAHLHEATGNASFLTKNAIKTLDLASEGDGTLATLLTDTTLSVELKKAVFQIKTLENSADRLINDLNTTIVSLEKDLKTGNGTAQTLMHDSIMANRLQATMIHVEKGTMAFAENMEALKSNFLFRRYFKKMEKKKKQ